MGLLSVFGGGERKGSEDYLVRWFHQRVFVWLKSTVPLYRINSNICAQHVCVCVFARICFRICVDYGVIRTCSMHSFIWTREIVIYVHIYIYIYMVIRLYSCTSFCSMLFPLPSQSIRPLSASQLWQITSHQILNKYEHAVSLMVNRKSEFITLNHVQKLFTIRKP